MFEESQNESTGGASRGSVRGKGEKTRRRDVSVMGGPQCYRQGKYRACATRLTPVLITYVIYEARPPSFVLTASMNCSAMDDEIEL